MNTPGESESAGNLPSSRREINVTPGHVPPPPPATSVPPPPPPGAPLSPAPLPPTPAGNSGPWFLRVPLLTPTRIAIACSVAAITDALQFALMPVGWAGVVQALDVIAMIATMLTIGFHPLLLPTVLLEAIPFVDALPTWTACVLVVIALRRKQQGRR